MAMNFAHGIHPLHVESVKHSPVWLLGEYYGGSTNNEFDDLGVPPVSSTDNNDSSRKMWGTEKAELQSTQRQTDNFYGNFLSDSGEGDADKVFVEKAEEENFDDFEYEYHERQLQKQMNKNGSLGLSGNTNAERSQKCLGASSSEERKFWDPHGGDDKSTPDVKPCGSGRSGGSSSSTPSSSSSSSYPRPTPSSSPSPASSGTTSATSSSKLPSRTYKTTSSAAEKEKGPRQSQRIRPRPASQRLQEHFQTIPWFTYRRDFAVMSTCASSLLPPHASCSSSSSSCSSNKGFDPSSSSSSSSSTSSSSLSNTTCPPYYLSSSTSSSTTFSSSLASSSSSSIHSSSSIPSTPSPPAPALASSAPLYTTDAGWGCMLRTGQMILGEALRRQMLGEAWRREKQTRPRDLGQKYTNLMSWFLDVPHSSSRYAIHHIVRVGFCKYEKKAGEWYGPTTAAQVLRDLVQGHLNSEVNSMAMLVPQEGVIYTSDVEQLCCPSSPSSSTPPTPPTTTTSTNSTTITRSPSSPSSSNPSHSHTSTALGTKTKVDLSKHNETDTQPARDPCNGNFSLKERVEAEFDPLFNPPPSEERKRWRHSLFILLPLRLGLDNINENYFSSLQRLFMFPQSLGIIGGKRGHSVYFVGVQGTNFLLLDPHVVQASVPSNISKPTEQFLSSVSCASPLMMSMKNVDPSMAVGFYCRDRASFEDLCRRIDQLQRECVCPFTVAESRPDYSSEVDMTSMLGGLDSAGSLSLSASLADADGAFSEEEDEYVLIDTGTTGR